MECNRDEALRAKEIAERKFSLRDYIGAKKFALKAQNLFPSLDGISQMLSTLDVYLASEAKINGEKDLYAILRVSALADEEVVKKQYRKLALQLHPDKNKSLGAEGAFQLVSEAWSVLSDRNKKTIYDQKISVKGVHKRTSNPTKGPPASNNGFHQFANNAASAKARGPQNKPYRPTPSAPTPPSRPEPQTFWTSCAGCCMQYEYHRMYLNKSLLCPKCRQPFLATELPVPPGGLDPPKWSSKQHINKDKNASATSGMEANAESYSNSTFQWGPFSGASVTTGANHPSTPASQATNVVDLAFDRAKRQREEAQVAARREEALRRRYNASKNYGSSAGDLNTGMHADKFVNKRGIFGHDSGQGQIDPSIEVTRNTCNEGDKDAGVSGDSFRSRLSTKQKIFDRDFTQVDIRALLMVKAKFGILKKIGELNSAEAVDSRENNKSKKRQKPKGDKVSIEACEENTEEKFHEFSEKEIGSKAKKEVLPSEAQQETGDDDSNEEINEPLSINVPDPDFHDFDNDRMEISFEGDQIWATYDDDDGMPRYYSLIQKVISANPFKVRMSYLTSKSNVEFSPLEWVKCGFAKTCGEFRIGRYEVIDTINIFSHRVKWEKGFRGVIKIIPRVGEIWALYKNWSPLWDEHTPDDVIHKYDMVEILGDYNEDQGISVVPLVKVTGFKTVFQRHKDPNEVKKIPREEMFRFSHHVPSYLLTGEEGSNAPKGCLELDPAATPLELLKVATDTNNEGLMNDSQQ
ncbi:Chaperone protein dnaJ 49 [Apostasia shenzhenica]|uniref:Chaperone protein dnaJ 49 n=1 Tax=Apostasia shenzhenica TaxID=1088818 RepID=A0A2I0AI68_9ASPA|nr:Chaperone protein dnaJ 49 [Apostasia shenzhenica]